MPRSEFLSVRPCGRDLYELIPKRSLRIDLDKASKALTGRDMEVADRSELALTMKGRYDLSLFPNGKMIVFPAKSAAEAESAGDEVLSFLRSEPGCVLE